MRMKRVVGFLISVWTISAVMVVAQSKVDEARMNRDMEIAENVLQTILRQEFGKRNFFPYEVSGSYRAGYGVTFRLPNDFDVPMALIWNDEPNIVINNGRDGSYSYSYSSDRVSEGVTIQNEECEDCAKAPARTPQKRITSSEAKKARNGSSDSLRVAYNQKIINASKTFIADYGDLISQLSPDERIVITNRNEGGQRFWYGINPQSKYTLLSIESSKADVAQYKQGKLTRDQLLAKMKVVNSETIDELNPDLELLSSIFNRLYRPDLSNTYYSEGNIFYERLKDFGVIYYMNVVSSTRNDYGQHSSPTLKLNDVDQATRDKKVKEVYPVFEKEIKANLLEYGRTLKSLKEDESLMLTIGLTKCEKCAIPSSLELSVKYSVLNDYNSGKLTKEAAMDKIILKKGPNQ